MKKLFLFVFAALAFAACEQAPIEEQSAVLQDATKSITVSFEGDDDTRIQLNEAQKTVWTEGDHVSVFYRSTTNEEWQFMGKTGDRTGQIVPVDNSVNPPATHNHVVVAYPYSADYFYNTETHNIEASLPAVQNYLKDSYGTNGNIMISSSEFNKVSLKSVCGWLKLQLTGDGEVVKSITLRGNDGEQVAGRIYVNSAAATATLASASGEVGDDEVGGTLVRPGTILTEVTLDCGEGVALGKNATAFYIALPPQTFEKGFTVEIEDTEGYVMEQSTDKALIIERNTIKPMADLKFTPSVPNNQIWYTSTDVVEPYNIDAFGATIISNEWDSETGKGIITFDGDVTTIGDFAFSDCDSLTSVIIGDSVTTIGDDAFSDCDSLTSVTIGDRVTTIGDYAFCDCTSLTSVNIPDSVTTIGGWAFCGCDSLTSVNIPDSVTSIGNYAFNSCGSLTEFTGKFAEDNGRILVVDGVLTAFAPAGVTEYTIPDSVTTIGDYAFYDCTSLTSVNIPDSVTTIGGWAFYGCDSLTSVTIPNSVTSIGDDAFSDCDSLTSVTIGDSVTSIGNYAFDNCTNLTSVNIPDSVTEIGDYAFWDCDSLTSVTIGDSVTTIGYDAFCSCSSLTSVYCKATTPPSLGNSSVFDYNGSGRKIYVPAGSVEVYKNAKYWSEYADAIVGYDFEKDEIVEVQPYNEIWYYAPEKINPYDSDVFGADMLTNEWDSTTNKGVITFDGDVTMIGDNAFYSYSNYSNCKKMTNIYMPNSVVSIGQAAFSHCTNLTDITLPNSISEIGDSAFNGCYSLKSVTMGNSVNTIGQYAFSGCGFNNIDIPNSVSSIGLGAFEGCQIERIIWPDSVTKVGDDMFHNCSHLVEIIIPDSVTSIGDSVFRECHDLISISLPKSIEYIGNWAFYNSNLKELYIEAPKPPIIYNNTFGKGAGDMITLEILAVPVESVKKYKSATYWRVYADAIVGYDFDNGVVVE